MTQPPAAGDAPLRLTYSNALDALDPAAIIATLTPDAEVRVAVHDAPMTGPAVRAVFGILHDVLDGITVTEEIIEGQRAVVLFETTIDGRIAHGLNVLRLAHDGRISGLVVFFRPLPALEQIATVVGARMAQQFGPPPEDAGS